MASSVVSVSHMSSSAALNSSTRSVYQIVNVGGSCGNSSWRTCPALVNVSSSMSTSPFQVLNVESSAKSLGLLAVGNSASVRASGGASSKSTCPGGGIVPGTRREMICHAKIEDAQSEEVPPMTVEEQAGWEQRQKEAAEIKDPSDPFQWRWTLNWNQITPNIIVGSCPRSPGDIDRMVNEAEIDAILNLQCDLCFDALKIPFDAIRKRAVERGVRLERVAIRDFDHADQSLMLPVAIRVLNSLVGRGMKVYVHCTAGINRATLTTVGHLTFVQQMNLEDAVASVKSARPVAHPYIDCWSEARRRLLDGRKDEVTRASVELYETRLQNGIKGTKETDWFDAEKLVISRTFQRYLETDLAMIDMETAWLKRKFELDHQAATGGNGVPTKDSII